MSENINVVDNEEIDNEEIESWDDLTNINEVTF